MKLATMVKPSLSFLEKVQGGFRGVAGDLEYLARFLPINHKQNPTRLERGISLSVAPYMAVPLGICYLGEATADKAIRTLYPKPPAKVAEEDANVVAAYDQAALASDVMGSG